MLTAQAARKSGYKRIKSTAASFSIVAMNVEASRRECVESYLDDFMYDVNGGELQVKKTFANLIEREKYEKALKEMRQNEYNLRVITQSDLLNHNYYLFPADQIHPEICFVRLKLCSDPRY